MLGHYKMVGNVRTFSPCKFAVSAGQLCAHDSGCAHTTTVSQYRRKLVENEKQYTITAASLHTFFGIWTIIGALQLPTLERAWEDATYGGVQVIQDAMPRDVFLFHFRSLHWLGTSVAPDISCKYAKIKPFLDMLNNNFGVNYIHGDKCSWDETTDSTLPQGWHRRAFIPLPPSSSVNPGVPSEAYMQVITIKVKRLLSILSTCYTNYQSLEDPEAGLVSPKFKRKSRDHPKGQEFEGTLAHVMYALYMNGVDKFDHLVGAYLASFKSSRWYLRLFACGWGAMCTNMYLCAKQCPNLTPHYVLSDAKPKKDHHFKFLIALSKMLLEKGRSLNEGSEFRHSPQKQGRKHTAPAESSGTKRHPRVRFAGKSTYCNVCFDSCMEKLTYNQKRNICNYTVEGCIDCGMRICEQCHTAKKWDHQNKKLKI